MRDCDDVSLLLLSDFSDPRISQKSTQVESTAEHVEAFHKPVKAVFRIEKVQRQRYETKGAIRGNPEETCESHIDNPGESRKRAQRRPRGKSKASTAGDLSAAESPHGKNGDAGKRGTKSRAVVASKMCGTHMLPALASPLFEFIRPRLCPQ